MNDHLADHVIEYIAAALDAADRGAPRPSPSQLTEAEAAEAAAIIDDLLAADTDPDLEIPPLSENPLAIRLGIAAEPPPVIVDRDAIAAALEGQDLASLAEDLSYYGQTADAGWLEDLAAGTIHAIGPAALRTLAVLVDATPGDLALSAVGLYPAGERGRLDQYLADTEWRTEAEDDHIAIVSPELRLGVIVAHVPDVEGLTALNIRRIAWEHLAGRWVHMHACVVVSPVDEWAAVVVDAMDCQPHKSAPTGILTYGPDPHVEPLRDALHGYAARFRVRWQPPAPLDAPVLASALIAADSTDGIAELLTGTFKEPKRTAWAEVRDVLAAKPVSAFEPFTDLEDDADLDVIEAMLDALASP